MARIRGAFRRSVTCAYGENEKKLLDDMVVSAIEMFEAMGATNIRPIKDDNPLGLVIHEMGTARMAGIPRPRCSTRTTRCGTCAMCSSLTALA